MDSFIKSAGDFGLYQKCMCALIGSLSSLSAMCIYAFIFVAAESDLICTYTNTSQLVNNTCEAWSSSKNSTKYSCSFDKTYYGNTIINEWNLVCDRHYYASLTQTSHMIGSICSLFSGYFGDTYGRRKSTLVFNFLLFLVLFLSQLFLSLFSLSIMIKYTIYTIAQFIIGMLVNCCYCTSYVLLLELTSSKYHTFVSNMNSYIYVFGELIVGLSYYYSKDWHFLNWIIVLYAFVSLSLVYFFLPESPKWLVTMKRYNDAHRVLIKIASTNNKINAYNLKHNDDASKLFLNIKDSNENMSKRNDNSSFIFNGLFFPKRVLIKTVFLIYIWNCLNLLYYGTSLGITNITVINPYLMYFLSCIAEVLGCLICHLNDILGRKNTFSGLLIASTVMFLLVAIYQHYYEESKKITSALNKNDYLMVIFALGAKAMVSGGYNIIYIFTSELYDTSIRNTAILFLICVGSIGSFVAPQINLLKTTVWPPLPFIIYTISAFLACLFVVYLPETK
jgi:MFS family permease